MSLMSVIVWMFNSKVEILTFKVMIFGGETFEKRLLVQKDGAHFNGISALIKETLSREPLAPSDMWGHSEKVLPMKRETNEPSPDTKLFVP